METVKTIFAFLTIANSFCAIGATACFSRFYDYHFKNAKFINNKVEIIEVMVYVILVAIVYFPIYFGVKFIIG